MGQWWDTMHPMATIEKRPQKNGRTRYRVCVRLDGHEQKTRTSARLTDARDWARSIEDDLKRGRLVQPRAAPWRTWSTATSRSPYRADRVIVDAKKVAALRTTCDGVPVSCDGKDKGWRLFAGSQFHRNFAVEAGYFNIGEASSQRCDRRRLGPR
jgi:hypothetical protein